MSVLWLSAGFFSIGYVINLFYISVLYHRALTHQSIVLSPFARTWTVRTGVWVTGIDPKAWACMHRLHHLYSDTEKDPHSPVHFGVFGVAISQLKYYKTVLVGLIKNKPTYSDVVKDLEFPVSWVNRTGIWYMPYLVHFLIAVIISVATQSPWPGLAYWLGIMSHPAQGWLVNSLAHRFGYRNHQTEDNSKNNTIVAWLVAGEGYQNNHHAHPESSKFSEKWYEFDSGYLLCKMASKAGFLKIRKENAS